MSLGSASSMAADDIGKHGKLAVSSAKIVTDAAIADSAKQMLDDCAEALRKAIAAKAGNAACV